MFINALSHTVYLLDPQRSMTEEEESNHAAKRFSKYLDLRKQCHGNAEWVDIEWKGGVLPHPTQQDASSCGVIVAMIAKAVMATFPVLPVISFETTRNSMALEREAMALQILKSSVFDEDNDCAMCSAAKPREPKARTTNWIQCDCCDKWFHEQCLGLNPKQLKQARAKSWNCKLCS